MYVTKRPGFAMIMAIIVILLVAGGGALLLRNVATSSKSIGDNYLHAQAELLAQSAIEYAVMQVQGFNDESGNCLNQLDINVSDASGSPMFDINVSINYTFKGAKPQGGTCTALQEHTGEDTRMLIDVTVNTNANANISTEPIRVHKRSWQKL
jgi:hypothetical protein